MLVGLFALVGVILLALESFHVGTGRWSPGWLGLGFVALAITWPAITHITG